MLEWTYDSGKWTAQSKIHDDGTPFDWVINVCADGAFSVVDSDVELRGNTIPKFSTFLYARDYCNKIEDQLTKSSTQEETTSLKQENYKLKEEIKRLESNLTKAVCMLMYM